MDKLLRDSLIVNLENFGYENIPKLENYHKEAISSMLSIPKIILDMSDKLYEKWKENPDWYKANNKISWEEFEELVNVKEKEDKEMITAEEARKIADDSNKNIGMFLEYINTIIKTLAEKGEYERKEYYNTNSIFSKFVYTIKEQLENKGYVVFTRATREDIDGTMADDYDYCMIINWREKK